MKDNVRLADAMGGDETVVGIPIAIKHVDVHLAMYAAHSAVWA